MKERRKKYRRFRYKSRGLKTASKGKYVHAWYWGIHDEFGRMLCEVRTDDCPHWTLRGKRMGYGYYGFDYERNRWVCRAWHDSPNKRLKFGWRYKVYG
jgi:hypothetical protein